MALTAAPDWRDALGDWVAGLIVASSPDAMTQFSASMILTALGRQPGMEPPETELRQDDAGFMLIDLLAREGWLHYPEYGAADIRFMTVSHGIDPALPSGARPKSDGWVTLAPGPYTAAGRVVSEAAFVLETLGLISGDRWSDTAHATLWRKFGNMHVEGMPDEMPFFQAAIAPTIATLPQHIADIIAANLQITQQEIIDRQMRSYGEISEDPETLLSTVIDLGQSRALRIEQAFARHWRLGDGWVEAADIGHVDGLASHMAWAVIHALHPESDLSRALKVGDAEVKGGGRATFLDLWTTWGRRDGP